MKKFLVFFVLISAFGGTSWAQQEKLRFFEEWHKVNGSCDTAVEIEIDYEKSKVTLENKVVGFCTMLVEQDLRTYGLTNKKESGGVVTYFGGTSDKPSRDTIVIDDFRQAVADWVRNTGIVVTETRDGHVRVLWSEQNGY